MLDFFEPRTLWQICSSEEKFYEQEETWEMCEKQKVLITPVITSSENFDLWFTSLNSAPLPIGVSLAQKSQRFLKASSCCWYAQDMQDQPRYASLPCKRHPTKTLEVKGGTLEQQM